MTSAVAFAYALLLRGSAVKDDLLKLLPQDRRVDIEGVLESSKEMPLERIRQELKALREDQLYRQRKLAESQSGLSVDRISPKLSAWLGRPF